MHFVVWALRFRRPSIAEQAKFWTFLKLLLKTQVQNWQPPPDIPPRIPTHDDDLTSVI